MITIGNDTFADIFIQVKWDSDDARHIDAYAARDINFWRDILPRQIKNELWDKQSGDQLAVDFGPGELFDNGDRQKIVKLRYGQFDPRTIGLPEFPPRLGRFYPKGLLKDVPGIFPTNRQPFRLTNKTNDHLTVDFGHALSNIPLTLDVTVGTVRPKEDERGGALKDWIETITTGVGMQARWQNRPTDYFSDNPFIRQDESSDTQFYAKERMVSHIDETADNIIKELYSRFVKNDMRVLDLMGSWCSHLPQQVRLKQVSGLGLNRYELLNNSALTDFNVKDLNEDPRLPYQNNHFDTILCTVAIEYLTTPVGVITEVARILRPGGFFVITFSNRWFPSKAIRLWTELHEYERMGLVLEYFRSCPNFTDLQTYSIRGLKRLTHDKYYDRLPFADPVYAVWGRKR